MSTESIVVRGARVHNLKNIDFEIPHNQLTVVTGVSGSGKSSLAFDTIYAEGQRRYVESLSAYARQFLERIEKPDADLIDGIAPAVAIKQKNSTRNPRSTVATATEIYDYLRLLFARVGRTFCLQCGQEVKKDTVDEVADRILALGEGTRLNVLFPLHTAATVAADAGKGKTRGRKSASDRSAGATISDAIKARLFDLRKRGFNRLFQNGQLFEFSTPESLLDINFSRPVFALVDRLAVSADARSRIVDAVEIGYREASEVIFETAPPDGEAPERLRFSQRFECKNDGSRYDEPEPRLFSFNNPYGACPRCQGFGNTIDFDLDLVIPDKAKTLNEGAIEPWTKPKYRPLFTELKRFARQAEIPLDVPWFELDPERQKVIINGEGRFSGVRGFFQHLERKKYKLHVRVFLSRYRGYSLCSTCSGTRLRPDARQVKIEGKDICQVCSMTVEQAARFFDQIKLSPQQAAIAEILLTEIQERLRFLNDVGLEYLNLDRLASTLSGGEAQRIQLATSLGSRLVGTLYVLDERKVIGAGTYEEIKKLPHSLTGRYLADELHIQVPTTRRPPGPQKIRIAGARAHNLKRINLEIPLGMLVAITGVSGSGKSTLLHDVLYQALAIAKRQANGSIPTAVTWDDVDGDQYLDEVVLVDQSPIGRTPRSNPVTYIKAFDIIRDLFASLPEAKKRGFAAGHFSFNVPGGRCENCQGDGTVTVEMQFLADVELICDECKGTRYKPQVLEIRYKGKNIHEVLNLTIREALKFFAEVPKLTEKLRVLDEVGLGYLRLGQSATTLSGGEAQRMKLASHLQAPAREAQRRSEGDGPRRKRRMLYIFDEPTTGLHFDDVSKLLSAFRRLIDVGGSIVVIEHNLEVIKTADWVIDLGPEGGERGGNIVGVGPPEVIAEIKNSYTGQYLARMLNGNSNRNGNKRIIGSS